MTDETPVNRKSAGPPAGVPMRKAAAGRPDVPTAARPRPVMLALYALAVAALFSIVTSLSVASQREWLTSEQGKANASAVSSAVSSATASAAKKSQDVAQASASASRSAAAKNPVAGTKLDDQVDTQVQGTFISMVLVLLVLSFLGYGAYRGRHWTRWGVTGFFILASFTGTGVGLFSAVNALLSNGAPLAIRIPTLLSSLSMIVAVVLVNMRPAIEYFALSRPVPAGGLPRRGLFGPRPPAGGARTGQAQRATRRPAGASAAAAKETDRQRAKKRANAESVARGAELARNRAKASKSRRTER